MLSIKTFATSALALFGVCISQAVHAGSGPDGKNMVDLSFDLPINPADPNSAKVSITGTIEQAVAKMEADYPGWNATFMSQPADALSPPVSRIWEPDHYNCNVEGDQDADQGAIWEGIEYLRKLNDTAKNGPGPDNCGRVSCSWNSAIVWCNNNNFEKELRWNDIADASAYVILKCALDETVSVKGRGDYTKEGWYVVLRSDWC
ncbi:hypothetical protein QBC40DRAFT_188319 [Triangularia verruculosa]|uniref:Uncharacterized protein n=1 Tax=Triangularia verruculosa TaxID=2587418 RepID=A0AAN7AMM8_9PEZI|nr:hypothetical protein QBC40DRAFT_188319 [Triangularia verruculosa]